MGLLVLLMIEAATVAPPLAASRACDAAAAEIVVCARRADPTRYRLPPQEATEAAGPPRAEWGLGGGVRAGVAISAKAMQQGVVSNRVMATVKMPF